jgi:hypothetical protein
MQSYIRQSSYIKDDQEEPMWQPLDVRRLVKTIIVFLTHDKHINNT